MNIIAKLFNETFLPWKIVFPEEALETRQPGALRGAGWSIQYLFGEDEKGTYLDYYARHRMTNDWHVRIYESGVVEKLESPLEFMVFPPNATEEEKKRIEAEYYAENRRIYTALAQKGFK